MDASMISRVLWLRRTLRRRERWSEQDLREHQRREAAALRAFASARSLFYQRFHKGLDRAPLAELPVLTKATLMDNFDDISTDPAVRLAELQAFLDAPDASRRFRGRYWVSATSGSSGRKSIIPSNAHEWATIIASYGRANEWAGIRSVRRTGSRWPWSVPPPPGTSPPGWPPPCAAPSSTANAWTRHPPCPASWRGSTRCNRTCWWPTPP